MKAIPTFLLLFVSSLCFSQDQAGARKTIDTLTSPFFWGRGYTKNGMQKAADYLACQFKLMGLKPLAGDTYFQFYTFPVNTFPGEMKVKMNGKDLLPGKEFIVSAESRGIKTKTVLRQKDSVTYFSEDASLFILKKKKLTWSVAQKAEDYTEIQILEDFLNSAPKQVKVEIENEEVQEFRAANIAGIVAGTVQPDSILFITAHYDHLGGMGHDTYFPGANDNASGIALLLDLAKYYAANPQPYSIGFICFSGEEAGLLGSKYFVEHPLVKLNSIRFLINLDLTGTGDEGITVVNASVFNSEFSILRQINESRRYLSKVNPRGKAANSDHFWFSQRGIPSFFIYTMGGIKAYHDVYDLAATLPLSSYSNLFKLIRDFNEQLISKRK